MRVIDGHVHWFDLNEYGETWYKGWPSKSDKELRKSFFPLDYYNSSNGSVDGAVHVQVAHEFDENLWVGKQNDEREKIGAMVCWIDLTQERALEELKTVVNQITLGSERKLVSFRHVAEAESNPDWLSNPNVIQNVKNIGVLGYNFDLLIRTRNLVSASILVQNAPETQFVIDHMAKPDVSGDIWNEEEKWKLGIEKLSHSKNVWCKLSGFYADDATRSFKPDQNRVNYFVSKCVGLFGKEKVFWGSDWPVSLGLNQTDVNENIKIYKKSILASGIEEDYLDNIFYQNAVSFYRLSSD